MNIYRWGLVGSGAVSLALCFVPLFQVFGYESAAATGLISGILVTFLTLYSFRANDEKHLFDSSDSPLKRFFDQWGTNLVFVILPAAIFLLNGWRVQTCDYSTALLFWIAIPVFSVAIGQLFGWLAALATEARWAWAAAGGLVLLTFVLPTYVLVFEPPIVTHHTFAGYYSGSIYDEALSFPESLAWYRVFHLCAGAAILFVIEGLWRNERGLSLVRNAVGVVVFAAAAFVMFVQFESLGIKTDSDYIADELGGRIQTEHFVIHYPANQYYQRRRRELARDHEFRYAQMREFFQEDPAEKQRLRSFIYANSEQKARLMGGRQTHVAKIWLDQMHLEWSEYGDHMLAHELAHLFTAPFGTGPLDLSMTSGLFVNMGLVEGVAVAADWPAERLDPHRVAAGLIENGYIEHPGDLIGAGGFWSRLSGQSYRVMGSFIRFLVEEYGIETFKSAYGTGAFSKAYGKPIEELISEWGVFLDDLELTESQLAYIDYRFDRPTIFEKVCPRTIGELRRRARRAASRGATTEMKQLYRQVVEYAPNNTGYRMEYARSLWRAGEAQKALGMVDDMLDGDPKPREYMRLLELKGDLSWQLEFYQKAKQLYRKCEKVGGLPTGKKRLLAVKREAIGRGSRVRRWMREYLVDEYAKGPEMYYPMAWHRHEPKSSLATYLVGRQLWGHDNWNEAIPYLERTIQSNALDERLLQLETQKMLVEATFFEQRWMDARMWAKRLKKSSKRRYKRWAKEWLERIRWTSNTD